MKTLVGTPDPQHPRNAATWTNSTGTTATGGNVRVDWSAVNVNR